jgi:hypothetical protein
MLAFFATFLFALWGRPLWTTPPDVAAVPEPGVQGAGDGPRRLAFVPLAGDGG